MRTASERYLAFAVVALGFFMPLLDSTIVSVSLPKIADYFSADLQSISWVINGYNLAFAVLLITASRLADQFGRKRVFLIGLFLFTVFSLLCGLASSVEMLVFFRVLQGLSAALLVPVSMPIIMDLFPSEKTGTVMGMWGAISAVAAASGPALGGIITELLNWQWIFYINIPIGTLTIALTFFMIRESRDPTASHRIDWAGIASLTAWSFALTLALIEANDHGWTSPYILSLFAAAAVGLVAFVLVELHAQEPMLPLKLLRNRPFAAGMISLFLVGIGLMCGVFFVSFFLVMVIGRSQLDAGLIVTALPLAAMVLAVLAGPLTDKIGGRWFSVLGTAFMCVAIYLFGQLRVDSTTWDVVWRLACAGGGFGLCLPSIVGASAKSVPAQKLGIASGVGNMAHIIGMVFGVALLVTVLTHRANIQMEDAKTKAELVVVADTALTRDVRDAFVSRLRDIRFSQQSRLPSEHDIVARFEQRRDQALAATSSSISKSVIRTVYRRQIAEVQELYPQVRRFFKESLADAFGDTFRFMCYLLAITVAVAYFSERPRRKRGRDAPHLPFQGL